MVYNANSPVKGFVVYPTYRIVDEKFVGGNDSKTSKSKKALVYLFGRLENGESFLVIKSYTPYFYIKKSDAVMHLENEKLRKVFEMFDVSLADSDFKNFSDEAVSKIMMSVPADVSKLRKILEDEFNIACYEADIRFYQRFLIDNDIKGTLEIHGGFKKGNYVDRIYEEPTINAVEWDPQLKILSIDIESDSEAKNLYCISLYTEGMKEWDTHKESFKKVIIIGFEKDIGKHLEHAITVNSEKDLLEKFKEEVLRLDPDIITGWNLIDFDLKVLKEKFDQHKIPFNLGRIDWPCKLDIRREFMRDSSADFPGRMVLDGITLLKTSYVKLENYKLDTAAEVFLGKKKLIGHEHKAEDIDTYYRNDQQKLVDYNLQDSELVYELVFKTKSIPLTIKRALVTGMTLDRVKASVASLDSLFLRYARKSGIVLGSSKFSDKDEPGRGGFVMNPKPGLYEYVIVLDFKSLYPSIIRTFNIDPYSYVAPKDRPSSMNKENYIVAANGAVFKNNEGILPKIIHDVWMQRDEAKRRKDPQATHALKIIMNSFYGVLGNPSCRFFNPEISNAITHTGQEIIKLTAKKVEELGYEVIYGDTDSIFFVSGADNENDAEKIGKKIQYYINEFYKEYIEKSYARKSELEIQFEKLFRVFLMPAIRGQKSSTIEDEDEEVGAKKRYAGLLIKDGKEEISFTGMEFVRGDWTELAKKFQLELFELVFHKKSVELYIRQFVKDLKDGKYDRLLVYKKNINKPLSEYTKTTPPHVKAARQLKKLSSNLIQYVITLEGPEPLELLRHKLDYEHYIDRQLRPIADTILSVLGKNFNDLLKNAKQTSLEGF